MLYHYIAFTLSEKHLLGCVEDASGKHKETIILQSLPIEQLLYDLIGRLGLDRILFDIPGLDTEGLIKVI